MELPFADVQSIVPADEAEDGFLTYDVNLSASSVETIIRMIWKGAPTDGDHGVHYTFSNGVTYDRATGHLRVPPGVKSFSLSRRVEYDDSVAFVLNPGLELNGTGVVEDNPDQNFEGGEMLANSTRTVVRSISIANPHAIEGSKFILMVNVQKQARNTYAAIRVTGPGSRDVDPLRNMTFSHGVKLHGNGKDLVIPKGVARFKVTIDIKNDKNVEREERLRFQVGNMVRNLVIAPTAEVLGVNAISRIEGGSLKFSVSVQRSNWKTLTFFGVTYKDGQLEDIKRINQWSATHGVTIDGKNRRFIIPAGVTNFTINIPTVDDTIAERTTGIRLNVGNRSASAVIWDDAEVASVTSPGALEGQDVKFVIKLKRASQYGSFVQLSVGAGSNAANTKDIEPISKWATSNGVRLMKNGYFFVPAKVKQFTVEIKTISDTLIERSPGEALYLNANGVRGRAIITEPARVLRVSYGSSKLYEGASGTMTVTLTASRVNRLLIYSLGGPAMYDYSTNLMFYGAKERARDWIQGSKQGIIQIPAYLTRVMIRIIVPSDKKISAEKKLIVGFGGFRNTLSVVDDRKPARDVLANMSNAIKFGHLNEIDKRQRAAMTMPDNQEFYNSPMSRWTYILDAESMKFYQQQQTVKSFLGQVATEVSAVRQNRKDDASRYLGYLYTDLAPMRFTTTGSPSQILYYANLFLIDVSTAVESAIKHAQRVREIFTDLAMTSQDTLLDKEWFTKGGSRSLEKQWSEAVDRFDNYFDKTGKEFEFIRQSYDFSKSEYDLQTQLNIIGAALAAVAALGSLGFLLSNSRAVHGQMAQYYAGKPGFGRFQHQLFTSGVNAPALFGSMALLSNNVGQSYIQGVRSDKLVSSRFLNIPSMTAEVNANLNVLGEKVQAFAARFFNMLHFIYKNGGAGDADVAVREVSNLKPDQLFPTDGFVNEPGYGLAWYGDPYGHDPISNTYSQTLWGIQQIPTSYEVKIAGPVALDLTGEALRFMNISYGARFDANDDGVRDPIAWVDGGTALLAFDIDGNNMISQTGEISFTRYKEGAQTDLEGLAAFDSDQDGVFSVHDAMWHRFGVWQDRNGDGISDPGEFKRLADHGIVAISLTSDRQASQQGDVLIYGRSQFWRADGSVGTVGDVGFRYVA